MDIQPFTIDNEADAKDYLSDLLRKPEFQSMSVVEARCAKLVRDPLIKAYFLNQGAEMLAELKAAS